MSPNAKEQELLSHTQLLAETVKKLFLERGELEFSKEPVLTKRNIVEYKGRMRADGMEKFNSPTFVAFINFYLDAANMQKHNALGAVIVYVEQDFIAPVMKKLKYPPINDEDNKAMCDACGTLCNIICGAFKSALVAQSFKELEMSHFSSYRNTAGNGVEFNFKEYDLYELRFELDNVKRLVLELTMATVPKGR